MLDARRQTLDAKRWTPDAIINHYYCSIINVLDIDNTILETCESNQITKSVSSQTTLSHLEMSDIERQTSEARCCMLDAGLQKPDAVLQTPDAGVLTSDAEIQTPDAELQTPDAKPLAGTFYSDAGRQTPDAITFGASEPRNFNSTRANIHSYSHDVI